MIRNYPHEVFWQDMAQIRLLPSLEGTVHHFVEVSEPRSIGLVLDPSYPRLSTYAPYSKVEILDTLISFAVYLLLPICAEPTLGGSREAPSSMI
jgi:hypothetical protein